MHFYNITIILDCMVFVKSFYKVFDSVLTSKKVHNAPQKNILNFFQKSVDKLIWLWYNIKVADNKANANQLNTLVWLNGRAADL